MTTTKPTLETMIGLYKAAWQQKCEGDWAIARVRDAIARHGFAEADVRRAAGILPHHPAEPLPTNPPVNTPATPATPAERHDVNTR